jgi:hypothetical protein
LNTSSNLFYGENPRLTCFNATLAANPWKRMGDMRPTHTSMQKKRSALVVRYESCIINLLRVIISVIELLLHAARTKRAMGKKRTGTRPCMCKQCEVRQSSTKQTVGGLNTKGKSKVAVGGGGSAFTFAPTKKGYAGAQGACGAVGGG